jgi:glycosyltransferase involved in cell wall biosynthesis
MTEKAAPLEDEELWPLVDVGIPTYRRPDYLKEAIESVLSQTFDRWRLQISEDGPGTSAVANAVEPYLSDTRIRYSAAGEQRKPAGNKNLLLRMGSAPFVAILDDDDRWHPTFLDRRVAFLDEHPACAFVFSAVNEIDERGMRLGEAGSFYAEGVVESEHFVPRLLQGYFVHTPSVLARRSAYETVGNSFDESLPFIYDSEMWFRLALHSPVGFLASCDADYRIHRSQDSFGVRPSAQVLSFLRHAEKVVARQPWGGTLSEEDRRRTRANWFLSAALDHLERGDRRTASTHLRQALKLDARRAKDKRTMAALIGILLGRRAGRFIGGSVRTLVRQQRWRRTRPRDGSRWKVG